MVTALLVMLLAIPGGARPADDDPIKSAETAAAKWLQLIDGGQYESSWDAASEFFKKSVARQEWKTALENGRKPLGALKSRKVKNSQYIVNPEGAPEGEYVIIQYESSFEGLESSIETLTPMKDKDGVWRVSGYYVK